jgi:hypothetical protein
MAEPFQVKPEDYLPGGRLYNNMNYFVPSSGKTVKDKATGVTYAPGSVAIPFVNVKSYEELPQEVKTILGGGAQYNPFAGATGYAYDPKTGSVGIQTGSGSYLTLGAKFQKNTEGGYEYSEDLTFPKVSDSSAQTTAQTLAAQQAAQLAAEEKRRQGQSAYALLFEQFERYGLGALVEPLKGFIIDGLSPAEFTLRLRETDAYKKRFAANQARIQKGLRALSEAEYIGLEDQYQDVMRRYGLPENYYTRGDMGRQEGFEKFIGGDVSPVELEDRIQTAQRRVINAAPEVTASLRQFYPEIGQGDLLAYFLDPDKAIENIKRKVTAAEIGGAATMAGLATGITRAEELARYGVTGEQARQGFQTIAEVAPRGSQLADIYKQTPYTQTTAEQEVFGLAGATEAAKQRKKLTQLEQASFSGSSGMAGGALGRERAGAF